MSSTFTRAFRPLSVNRTSNAVVGTTATSLTLLDRPYGTQAVRLVNSGTDTIFISFSEILSGPVAANTSLPMLPNTVEVFTISNDVVQIRALGITGGNTLYVTYGEGL